MWMKGCQSRGPASSSNTLVSGSSERRLASTQPAEPAPMMMKSNMPFKRMYRPTTKTRRRYAPALEQLLGGCGGGAARLRLTWPIAAPAQAQDDRPYCRKRTHWPIPGCVRRIPAAAVVVRLLLLPAQRLLRAAPGARGDGRLQRRRRRVPAGDDRVLRGPRHPAEGTDPAGVVYLHLPDHAGAAAGVWRAGQPVPAAGVPAGGVRFLHRHLAAVLRD